MYRFDAPRVIQNTFCRSGLATIDMCLSMLTTTIEYQSRGLPYSYANVADSRQTLCFLRGEVLDDRFLG